MFCSNCGSQLPDGANACPSCGTVTNNAPVANKKSPLKAPGKGAKSYAAIFTALLVFPSTLCIALDLSFDKYDYWFGYVVGALLCVWVCAVLPVLKITPPAVTALACFTVIVGYVFFIANKTGHFVWLYKLLLPMFILSAAFIAIDVALIGDKVKGLHIFSLLSGEACLWIIALEATLDNLAKGTVELGWSLIISCAFISVIAVFEAFSYVGRLNKK